MLTRQGEEWYRIRAVVSKKMLRPYEVFKHVGPMDETAADFVQHIERKRQDDGSIPDLEHEIFKWALECKFYHFSTTIISTNIASIPPSPIPPSPIPPPQISLLPPSQAPPLPLLPSLQAPLLPPS